MSHASQRALSAFNEGKDWAKEGRRRINLYHKGSPLDKEFIKGWLHQAPKEILKKIDQFMGYELTRGSIIDNMVDFGMSHRGSATLTDNLVNTGQLVVLADEHRLYHPLSPSREVTKLDTIFKKLEEKITEFYIEETVDDGENVVVRNHEGLPGELFSLYARLESGESRIVADDKLRNVAENKLVLAEMYARKLKIKV